MSWRLGAAFQGKTWDVKIAERPYSPLPPGTSVPLGVHSFSSKKLGGLKTVGVILEFTVSDFSFSATGLMQNLNRLFSLSEKTRRRC